MIVLISSFSTVSTFGRVVVLMVVILKGMVLKEVIFNSFYIWEGVCGLERTDI